MDIEETSTPYRGFLRSGTYPALTKRIVMSGGVLLRAAGWFALVVTAASAGYSTTQRLVSQSAATERPQLGASTPQPLAAATQGLPQHAEPREPLAAPKPELTSARALSAPSVQRASVPAQPARTGSAAFEDKDKDRSGATKHKQVETDAIASNSHPSHTLPDVEASATQDPGVRTALIAERVRALDGAPHAANAESHQTVKEPEAASSPTEPAAHQLPVVVSGSATESTLPSARDTRPTAPAFASTVAPKPLPPATSAKPVAPSGLAIRSPLTAATRIDSLAVNGSVSSANVRHGVERVQPTLTECYERAARKAGENRFSQVRVVVMIDEAGRVKTQPTVVGAELPGLDACLSAAFSKLVCRAPDTGTARASITLRFGPLALAAANRVETR